MHTGYHYTSYKNWEEIKLHGLVPSPVSEDKKKKVFEAAPTLSWDGRGIWVWRNLLGPTAHAGAVLYQLATKGDPKVVLLQVHFTTDIVLGPFLGDMVQLSHTGCIGVWQYHDGDPAVLLHKPVPPIDIRLLGIFDIVEALGSWRREEE